MRTPPTWPRSDYLTHRATTTPEATALIDPTTTPAHTHTYETLDTHATAYAASLAAHDLTPGDHVGVLLSNRPELVDLVHAVMRLGATLIPLNPTSTTDTLTTNLDHADADALVCDHTTEPHAARAFDGPILTIDDPHHPQTTRIPHPNPPAVTPTVWTPDDPVLLMFTSGTTATPKPVTITARNLTASATASAYRLGTHPDDTWLCCLPMCHMGGIAPVYRMAHYAGAVIVQPTFDPPATIAALEAHNAAGVSLVPTMLRRLLDADWHPPASLRCVLLGGAPAPDTLITQCETAGVPVHPTYGMTETASQIATARPHTAFDHPGTVGPPLLFTTVTILDQHGTPRPPGEPGRIAVDGPTVTPGYYADNHATNESFCPHGLLTGDIGHLDTHGRLWVHGRADDLINTGGELVNPREIATTLTTHPEVTEAAVVGLPDPDWGERVAALVVPAHAHPPTDLHEYCRDRLAGPQRPKHIEYTDTLPRTSSGTIDRNAVRDHLTD